MIQVYYVKKGQLRKLARNEDFKKVWRDSDFIWINAVNPTLDEHTLLGLYLSVEPKSLMRIIEESTKGRYHRFYEFSAFHFSTLVAEPFPHTDPSLILLGERIVATIGDHIQPDAIEEVEETLRNLVSTNQQVTTSVVVVRIVQEIIERNILTIDSLVQSAMYLEEKFADVSLDTLLSEIQRIRHIQNEIYQHLTSQRHFVDLMLQHVPRYLELTEDLQTLLFTALSEIERQQQILELNARSLTDLVALHSVLLANRLNRVIVLLTTITVTVAVPSLVANILGMYNILHPDPLIYLPGSIPIFTWQIQLLVLLPAVVIPLIWVIKKGWIRIYSPKENLK